MQAQAEGGDNEGELTYLRERETALHGHLEALTCNEHAESAEHYHSRNNHCRQQQNGPEILAQNRRLNHHAHGNKEHGPE